MRGPACTNMSEFQRIDVSSSHLTTRQFYTHGSDMGKMTSK